MRTNRTISINRLIGEKITTLSSREMTEIQDLIEKLLFVYEE